jgi:hypothetical protein
MAMSRYEALARRLVLVLGLGVGAAACDGGGPLANDLAPVAAPTAVDPAAQAPAPAAEAAGPTPPTPVETVPAPTTATWPSPTLAALEAQAEAALAHLRSLQIVEVRDLVLRLPDASSACYGQPCPAAEWDQVVTWEYQRQVPRLVALAASADDAIHNSYPYPIATTDAPKDVEALNALSIVNLGALLVEQPANDPLCYNTPCPGDVSKATADTGMRAFYLHTWVWRAHSTGKL